ncbi:MAG: 4Fe-4S dicluster domain-containing protein [Planctomycetes bacterium]|nr:4Fe-4S dicluster domain-containing protein [Planctomycetota bacterium]
MNTPEQDSVDRREFLQFMAASIATAGLAGCARQPEEKIVPYVRPPEILVPGKPLVFATVIPFCGIAAPVLVESHEGRPTKVEGNPQHPGSLGAADAFAQASVLSLYDPDRAQVVASSGNISTWSTFLAQLVPLMAQQRVTRGAGLRILTESVTSPTLLRQLDDLLREFPDARWHAHEPVRRPQDILYRVDRADVILTIDSDLFSCDPGNARTLADFAARRVPPRMNRLYAIESTFSGTGAAADHRRPGRACDMESFAWQVLDGIEGKPPDDPWIAALVRDLLAHRGSSLVVTGHHLPPTVLQMGLAINQALDNVGRTVVFTDPPPPHPSDIESLVQEMNASRVHFLLILGANPVYTAPADLHFTRALDKVLFKAHLSLYEDETSERCDWHIPEAHPLESWSDARACDGTVSIVQPLIAPLYGGRTAHELIAALVGKGPQRSYDLVRATWRNLSDTEWETALHDGFIKGSALPPASKTIDRPPRPATTSADGMEIVIRPDPSVWDGRFANNAWLQELPKPLSHLTWDNAALLSPRTAARLDLKNEDVIELRTRGRSVQAPVWIMPGNADDSITVHLGYGRTRAGRVGTGAGFNAYPLRTSDALGGGTGLVIRKTGLRRRLASTQSHHRLDGRDHARRATIDKLPPESELKSHPSLYPEFPYKDYAWGMTIDLSRCTGCNACVVACQAENNVPVVGKDEVLRGREMHWLRIDTCFSGPAEDPDAILQPMLCVHCEKAPCEVVCPVNATVHDGEGLNAMIYNRCVGTRYCSNNCPYKVRRFNFFGTAQQVSPVQQLQYNPDVTVRGRGVMEKCTYCVQRISASRIQTKKEDRLIRDGELLTACQQACPAGAIVFGNLNDPTSRVSQLKRDPRNYAVLADLNTRPRTTHLLKVRNPNPEISDG